MSHAVLITIVKKIKKKKFEITEKLNKQYSCRCDVVAIKH